MDKDALKTEATNIAKRVITAMQIERGLTSAQHSLILAKVAVEKLKKVDDVSDIGPLDFAELRVMLEAVSNCSALRQKMEKAGILETSAAPLNAGEDLAASLLSKLAEAEAQVG